MANTIGYGQAAVNNTIGYGQGAKEGSSFSNLKSIELDGVDDYVDTATIDIGSTNSISFWMKRSTLDNGVVLGDVNASPKYAIWLDSSNNLYFKLGNNNAGFAQLNSSLFSDGNWHHHCLSRNGIAVNYYIDAVLQTISVNTLNAATGTTSTIQKIGIRTDLQRPLNASLDEVALFNTNLSASDVTDIYNSGVPASLSSYSSLVSWWRCGDSDTAPTLTDNKGSNDGTMTNFSTFSTDVPT